MKAHERDKNRGFKGPVNITVVIGITFFVLSSLICLLNITNSVLRMVRKRRGTSRRTGSNIHVLSLVFSIMAYVFAGARFGLWVFIPVILDPANLFLFLAPFLIAKRLNKSGKNRQVQ